MTYFCCFLLVGPGRNAIFSIFCSSAMAEMPFFRFFACRPWPKPRFYYFGVVDPGRNTVFTVLSSSAQAETLFLSFSARRPRPRRCFVSFSELRDSPTDYLIIGQSTVGKRLHDRCRSQTRHCYYQRTSSLHCVHTR